ncbi:MAG: HlyD family efflux transporter periplasmic adaptor subunit [Chloroflexi bacterium]|nr:HlyD family efflux transporter periplasmic adaptor subunit [Chloroflexota bacterium]
MRKLLLVLFVLVVISTLSWFGYQATAQEKEPPPPDYEIYTVSTGDIAAQVTAIGSIEPLAEVSLSFRGAGRVAELDVAVGDAVHQGQVLARLDTAALQLAREQAEIGLRLAEANLAKAQQTPDPLDIAAAEAALESARAGRDAAQVAYADLLRGPSVAQRKATEASLERARVMLNSAQQAYDQIASSPNAGMLPQAVQLQQATIDYEVAKANVDVTLAPPTASQKASALAQIAQAESAVVQAEAARQRLQKGISVADLIILQAQVDQAHVAIKQADLALADAELIAPMDGIVGLLNLRLNESYNPALPAVVLSNPSTFHVELNVDEIDIGQVRPGQPAQITIDALDNAKLDGIVSAIAPIAGTGAGALGAGALVTYQVTVSLPPSDLLLRAGMTASVAITTNEARNVVLLPNRVMRLDQQTGETYVEKIIDGIPTRVNVEIGLRNEQFSHIVSGLEVGDELAIRRVDTGDVLRRRFFGG